MKLLFRLGLLFSVVILFGGLLSMVNVDATNQKFTLAFDSNCVFYVVPNEPIESIADQLANASAEAEGPCKDAQVATFHNSLFIGYVVENTSLALTVFRIPSVENQTTYDLSSQFTIVDYASVLGPCTFSKEKFSMFVDFRQLHMVAICNENLGAFVRAAIFKNSTIHTPFAPLVYFKTSTDDKSYVGVSADDYDCPGTTNICDSMFLRVGTRESTSSPMQQTAGYTFLHDVNNTHRASIVKFPISVDKGSQLTYYMVDNTNSPQFSLKTVDETNVHFAILRLNGFPTDTGFSLQAEPNSDYNTPVDLPLGVVYFMYYANWRSLFEFDHEFKNFTFSVGTLITEWTDANIIEQPKCDVEKEFLNVQKCADDADTNKVVVWTLYGLCGIEFAIVLITIITATACICSRRAAVKKRKQGKSSKPKGSKDPKSKDPKSKDPKSKEAKDKKGSKDPKSGTPKPESSGNTANTKPVTSDTNANPKK